MLRLEANIFRVPQGSVLGPLLFLVFINDITVGLDTKPLLYADDTVLFEVVSTPAETAFKLNSDLQMVSAWSEKWLVTMNPTKCKAITFSVKHEQILHPELFMNGSAIIEVDSLTHLGLTLQSNLSWKPHVMRIHSKASTCLNVLKSLKFRVERVTLDILYKSLVRPLMEYADFIWASCTDHEKQSLENIQYEAARVVTGAIRGTSYERLRFELGWEKIETRRLIHKLVYFYKIVHCRTPSFLTDLLPLYVYERTRFALRSRHNFCLYNKTRTQRFYNLFFPTSVRLWNYLNIDIRSSTSLSFYKKEILHIFSDNFKSYKLYDYSLTRYASILQTRLRLGFSGLNSYLFKINRKLSPSCACGYHNESVLHYFLTCPRYAAQRSLLFYSAMQTLGNIWSSSSEEKKLELCLHGSKELTLEINQRFFAAVQTYILKTNRFSQTTG